MKWSRGCFQEKPAGGLCSRCVPAVAFSVAPEREATGLCSLGWTAIRDSKETADGGTGWLRREGAGLPLIYPSGLQRAVSLSLSVAIFCTDDCTSRFALYKRHVPEKLCLLNHILSTVRTFSK